MAFPLFVLFVRSMQGLLHNSLHSPRPPSTALSPDKVLGHFRGRCNILKVIPVLDAVQLGRAIIDVYRRGGNCRHATLCWWWGKPGAKGFVSPPARRSVGIFRCQPSASITEPASVRININIGPAVSAGSGKHEGVMIGG